MDWFQGSSVVGGSSSHHRHSSSRHDSKHENKQDSSRSIFGLGNPRHNSSRPSLFGFPIGRSSSYYKRSPRNGFLQRMFSRLRRLLRDLIHFMKKHPMRVFMLVIMPLLTGGALAQLLARFGIRLPAGLDKMFGGRGGERGVNFESTTVEGPLAAIGGLSSLAGGLGGVAKLFM